MNIWLTMAIAGGLVGLDTTSCPQIMISRPVVAGTATGALLGNPIGGLTVGFVMEAFALLTLPVGAARYPEAGTATVAAVGGAAAFGPGGFAPGALAIVIAFALAWEWVGGQTVILLRRTNGKLLLEGTGVSGSQLERRHLTAMVLDFVRGAAVTTTGGLLVAILLLLAAPAWSLPGGVTMDVLAVLTAGMVGTAVPLFGGVRARRLALLTGLVTGLVMAALLA
jgi:mannose/fructose/N-acetylgalactosamine-specific phosphotransferase system component IIC